MEYRQLPQGSEHEKFSVIGLGLGGIGTTPVDDLIRFPTDRRYTLTKK